MKHHLNISNLQRPCNNVQGRQIAALNNSKIPKKQKRGFGVITVAMALIIFAGLLKFWAFALVREHDAARAEGLFHSYQSYARAARLTGSTTPQSLIPHYAGMPDGVTLRHVSASQDPEILFDFSALPLAQRQILRGKLQRWLSQPELTSVATVPVKEIPTDRPQYILRAGDNLFTDLKFEGSNTITNLKPLKVNSVNMMALNAVSVKLDAGSLLTVIEPVVSSAPFSAELFTVPQLRADKIEQDQDGQLVTRDFSVTDATTITDLTAETLTTQRLEVTDGLTTLVPPVVQSQTFTNLISNGASVGATITDQMVTEICIGC